MKVGLTKEQCLNYKQVITQKDEEINALHSYIEGINNYFKQAQDIGSQIHNLIIPLIRPIQPLTLDKYVDLSTIKGHNKRYLKTLFKKYIDYCKENLNLSDYKVIDGCPLDLNLDIYNPDNALKFMKEKCKFNRSSIKKIRDIFLLAFRKCTRNPSLDYSVPLGKEESPNIKHYIKYNELFKFMNYLKMKKDYELSIIFEILYKFGIRVSALAKIKVQDISEDGMIIFHEKNQKIVKRQLKTQLFNKLKQLIKIHSLKLNDFLFYSYISPKDIDERAKIFSNKLSKVLKESQCFDKKENETISAHMLRATHAINVFQKYGLEMAAKELNHSRISTTAQHYLKVEDRGLLANEEEKLFFNDIDEILFGKNNIDIKEPKPLKKVKIKTLEKTKNEYKINSQSLELDLDDPELDNDDNSLFDHIFDIKSFSKINQQNAYNKDIFLNKKRNKEKNENIKENLLEKEIHINYENFIKENKIQFSEIKIIEKKFVPKIGAKKSEKNLNEFLKNNNLIYDDLPKNLNENINSVNRAYSLEGIIYYDFDKLKEIHESIKYVNIFKYKI